MRTKLKLIKPEEVYELESEPRAVTKQDILWVIWFTIVTTLIYGSVCYTILNTKGYIL